MRLSKVGFLRGSEAVVVWSRVLEPESRGRLVCRKVTCIKSEPK